MNHTTDLVYKIGFNQAILEDHWASNSYHVENITYISCEYSYTIIDALDPGPEPTPYKPLMNLLIWADDKVEINTRIRYTILNAL